MDVALLYLLLPQYGIVGYFLSFTVTHVINFFLSLRRLLKITDIHIRITIPIRAILAACLSVFIASFVPSPVMQTVSCVIVLFCLLYLSGVIAHSDGPWLLRLLKIKDRP